MQSNPQTSVKNDIGLPAAAYVADTTGTGRDMRGFQELLVIVNAGTFTGAASAVVIIEESSDVAGSGDAFATVHSFTAITTANDAQQHFARIKLSGKNRYMRARLDYTGNGTDLAPLAVEFVKMGAVNSALCNDTYDGNVQS